MAKSKKSSLPKIKARLEARIETKVEGKTRSKIHAPSNKVMGMPLKTWVESARRAKGADGRAGRRGFLFAFSGSGGSVAEGRVIKKALGIHLNRWQLLAMLESESESQFFQGVNGPVWLLKPTKLEGTSPAKLEKNGYARLRDLAGAVVGQLAPFKLDKLLLELNELTLDEERAVLIGLEMASYCYQENRPQAPKMRKRLPEVIIKSASEGLNAREIKSAAHLALCTNIARHYVNLPGNSLNPRTYAESVIDLFRVSDSVSIDVWHGDKLKEEKMGLLFAVGNGATEGPRMVHLKYRPLKGSAARPLAIVGKGITFDSGGLDLKPSSAMRLMKKDMGGSAAVVGLLKWAELTSLPLPIDAYLSLAENSIGSGAFRPGDVLLARSGMTIEIGNTDAEGRLVLADALDVAVSKTGADKPRAVINVATLTGAIKVGLGAEIAGLFANDDRLANLLTEAGLQRGDFMWRMPLFQAYRSQFKSTFADCSNCADGSFGGAITAALFLESFVKNVPWAHLDVYSWKDSAGGAWAEAGGSGQPVQALAEALTRIVNEDRLQSEGAELA
jgi:leucyl aminopeptidase